MHDFLKDHYKERKETKASENPKARNSDPECWSCLSDEQRDTICEWYYSEKQKELEQRDEEEQKKSNVISLSSILALVPLAVGTAYHSKGGFWGSFIAAWIIDAIVFALFYSAYELSFEMKFNKSGNKIAKVLSFLVFAAVGALVSWMFLNLIYR